MSDRALRAMYAAMVRGRAALAGARGGSARAAYADVACVAAGLAGLRRGDVVSPCRADGVLEAMGRASLPWVEDGVGRLYAAAGAAMLFEPGSERVTVSFFERHETDEARWTKGLKAVAALPLVLVVMPRWRGEESEDLGRASRKAGVPGIAVDAADAIAVYRVAQESLVRARMGGGAAVIEGVWFRAEGEPAKAARDAVAGLGEWMAGRGVASRRWLDRVGSAGSGEAGKRT